MANEKPLDIFNLGVEDIDSHEKKQSESVLYKPTADAGKDGVYKSLIRFVPNVNDPKKSIIRKFVYWLTDAEGNSSYYDSPTTIGEKCPVQDLFFKLYKSESAADKKMATNLKRREVFYSVVQIIIDPHNKELEGKYKIFKYGQKIKEKIDGELNPEYDTPTQIFDLFEGKNFELTITKQSGFNNYDSSKFQGKQTPISIDGTPMENISEHRELIMNSLKDAPDVGEFDFKAWDDGTKEKINSILNQYRSPGESIDNIVNQKGGSGVSVDDEIKNLNALSEDESTESNSTASEITSDSEDDDLNNFLNDLK